MSRVILRSGEVLTVLLAACYYAFGKYITGESAKFEIIPRNQLTAYILFSYSYKGKTAQHLLGASLPRPVAYSILSFQIRDRHLRGVSSLADIVETVLGIRSAISP